MGNASETAIILRYVAIVLRRPESGYMATAPDLGACFGYGDTVAAAKTDLTAALELHVAGMREDMMAMPPARECDEIRAALGHDVIEDYIVEIAVAPLMRTLHPAVATQRPS